MSIVIEDLFPEVGNLFGDTGNMRYLVKSLPEAEYIRTPLNGRPAFADRDVNMIYMGPMTESSQLEVMKRLLPFKERINEMIENGTVCRAMLFKFSEIILTTLKTEKLNVWDFSILQSKET